MTTVLYSPAYYQHKIKILAILHRQLLLNIALNGFVCDIYFFLVSRMLFLYIQLTIVTVQLFCFQFALLTKGYQVYKDL